MAVCDTDFNATYAVTDVMDAGKTEYGGAVDQTGVRQGNVYSVINSFITNFNGTNGKLDLDAGVSGTNFAACWDLSTATEYKLYPNGMHQCDLAKTLTAFETNFDGLTAKLDLDAGVADTDYAACTAFNMCTTGAVNGITNTGISQGGVVNYLNTVVTCFNKLLTKLDADA